MDILLGSALILITLILYTFTNLNKLISFKKIHKDITIFRDETLKLKLILFIIVTIASIILMIIFKQFLISVAIIVFLLFLSISLQNYIAFSKNAILYKGFPIYFDKIEAFSFDKHSDGRFITFLTLKDSSKFAFISKSEKQKNAILNYVKSLNLPIK